MRFRHFASFLFLIGVLHPESAFAACDWECKKCLIYKPFSNDCLVEGNDPICEATKQACQGCIAAKAATVGLGVECVACVVSALATAGVSTAACLPICGTAAAVEAATAEAQKGNKCLRFNEGERSMEVNLLPPAQ